MIESFAYGMVAIFVLIPVAVLMFSWLLRRLDDSIDVKFKTTIAPAIATNALACAIYFGCRLLAVALIVSTICGRFV